MHQYVNGGGVAQLEKYWASNQKVAKH